MIIDKKIYNQKGVSLIITFFIMIIILAVVLSISVLLYSEVRVIRNMGNSIGAYYSAESGVEKVLYFDRQVIPKGTTRGLCAMLVSTYEDYCAIDEKENSEIVEHSMYCNKPTYDPVSANGCDPEVCNDCSISFETKFDNRTYNVTATINSTGFSIDSGGNVGDASRKIQIEMAPQLPPPI